MLLQEIQMVLPEGTFRTNVATFGESDRKTLFTIYKRWKVLSDNLIKVSGRGVNIPEGLSEGAFCLEMGVVRKAKGISGADASFDCYDLETNERIQVKACSVNPDLTSFAPTSAWDRIYLVDFYREGNWDGTFDIYLLDNEDIYSHQQNATQTFRDMQLEGKRPRFSIFKDIINPQNLQPIKTGNLDG